MKERWKLCALVGLVVFLSLPAFAQEKKYVLAKAVVEIGDNTKKRIEVQFTGIAPPAEFLKSQRDWFVQKIKKIKPGESLPADDSERPKEIVLDCATDGACVDVSASGELVTLTMKEAIEQAEYKIVVMYLHGNLPSVVLGEPQTTDRHRGVEAAEGKDDADVYFSGAVAAARGSKPLYTFESKLRYLRDFKHLSIGGRAEVAAAKESNIDPDSILFGLAYEKIFPLDRIRGIILEGDFLGGEFDKENRTRNLASSIDARFVLRSRRFKNGGGLAGFTFLLGGEGGHNYRSKLNEEGFGNYWRWKVGAIPRLVRNLPDNALGLKRIVLDTEYLLRLPRTAEPFTKKVNGKEQTVLTTKPRHYVGSNLQLMFSDYFGLAVQYRYGSLPPAFKFVEHAVTAGLTFQLKRADE